MEAYILDDLLRRTAVIDRFESMIWTERYSAFGDFELHMNSTVESRRLLNAGNKLAINESWRYMTIETVEDTVDAEGRSLLKATGRSGEAILDDRVATDGFVGTGTNPSWTITDKPADICRQIFQKICVDGFVSVGDIIPFYKPGNIFAANTIPEPATVVTVDLKLQTVYKAIKDLCDVYNLGFRLVRNLDKSELYFNIYTGDDRTTFQTVNQPVVFSPDFNNVKNTTQLTSIASFKNVAYVFSKNGATTVYSSGASASTSGFDRRVMEVEATDIDDALTGQALTDALTQKGVEALAKQRNIYALDGEITQNSEYQYGLHYDLGDLVEMRSADGSTNKMRVTEQIFVEDNQGFRSYPTLTVEEFITSGSWLNWNPGQNWADLADDVYWADL